MKLDPKGLEAAREQPGTNHDGIIRAYLTALTPAEVGGLVDTLRSMSHDDNTRACVSVNITVSNDLAKKLFDVLHAAPKAATALEAQAAELAAVHQRYVDADEARIDAEAQLAEAKKALEASASALDEAMEDVSHWGSYAGEYFQNKHDLEGDLDRIAKQASAARRALTGGQEPVAWPEPKVRLRPASAGSPPRASLPPAAGTVGPDRASASADFKTDRRRST